ncbi:related to general repressor of transcription [Phialocephala subalpina]|uniref:Related to general repressor of transcription n=1 Tax=Phialocephala subalpina TaxID=576137 RepID=A0A1L7WZN9_9HELO|nr:related to general repressor of transcription [Phialocephala subalpina]
MDDTSPSMEPDPRPAGANYESSASRQPEKRRARVACKRCRRLRKKCLHEDGQAPCLGCRESGFSIAQQCRFPTRGEPDLDREYRRRKDTVPPGETSERHHSVSASLSSPSSSRTATAVSNQLLPNLTPPPSDRWNLLPPHNEVVDAVKVFGTSFFQLGFIPKALFLEQLANSRSSINVFYLLGILSVSARFTPSLIARYGDGLKAAEVFMDHAASLVMEEMYTPTLDRTQGFFLLAIAEWGKGDKTSSNIHMGIAVRMAGMLRLHREETYDLPENYTAEDVINAEMARRTFWMLESQDNLHSGYTTPTSFSLSDITTLLPCEERDFAFGVVPRERTALTGTLAAVRKPDTVHTCSRSLFATLIQAHNLWGQVARRAVTSGDRQAGELFKPWDNRSDYATLLISLQAWESHLPSQHKWSIWNFRGYKAEGLDLAYLSVVMVIRLSNIILRRTFIDSIIHKEANNGAPENFWMNMSSELFENVLALHEQIDAFFNLRSPQQGFPAMIVFCVYVCGSLANHLWRRPEICPSLASGMGDIVSKSLEVLTDLQHAWPLARKWRQALDQRASMIREEQSSRAVPDIESGEAVPPSHQTNTHGAGMSSAGSGRDEVFAELLNHEASRQARELQHGGVAPPLEQFAWDQHHTFSSGYYSQNTPPDDIEAQLAAFLQVQGQLGMLYD